MIPLMVQKSGVKNQLRLVVYPMIYKISNTTQVVIGSTVLFWETGPSPFSFTGFLKSHVSMKIPRFTLSETNVSQEEGFFYFFSHFSQNFRFIDFTKWGTILAAFVYSWLRPYLPNFFQRVQQHVATSFQVIKYLLPQIKYPPRYTPKNQQQNWTNRIPYHTMYGIFTYILLIFEWVFHVGKYTGTGYRPNHMGCRTTWSSSCPLVFPVWSLPSWIKLKSFPRSPSRVDWCPLRHFASMGRTVYLPTFSWFFMVFM